LCQEDPYLLELVGYIHLNPVRAGIVKGLDRLESYRLCFWCVRELGMSMASLFRKLNVSVPAVGKAVFRGEKIVGRHGWSLVSES
jgi:hypothetical protein